MGADRDQTHNVWITGVGLLSSLGEGTQTHWDALMKAKAQNVDNESFAPYPVHRLAEPDWSQQISRRDMRQMEPWQQIGTYTAGLALDDAQVKGNEELLSQMDMIVAAGGGERDIEVDETIMQEARTADDRDAMLAERLSNDLRPTLFLAQLSNLLAGNISIVHKVTGSSRTFMGEEGAGISAIQTAYARIASGQSDIALVGGAYNSERLDMLLLFALGGFLHKGTYDNIAERAGSGMITGSVGVFLVLESQAHAKARGVQPYGQIDAVVGEHGNRRTGNAEKRLKRAGSSISLQQDTAVLSGMSGCDDISNEETGFLNDVLPQTPTRAYGNLFGHGVETQFPLGVALAALSVKNGKFYPPFEATEREAGNNPGSILVTTAGHNRAEGLALVVPADG